MPPPVVQVRASTRAARFETGWPTVPVFLAPAGSLLVATGLWQSVMRPVRVTVQVEPGFPLVNGNPLVLEPSTGALGCGDALALGCGDALALGLGVVLAWASPVSMRVLAAVAVIRAGHRPMPGRRFHFNAGPPRQIRRHYRGAVPRALELRPVRYAATTMSETFHFHAVMLPHVRQGQKVLKIGLFA